MSQAGSFGSGSGPGSGVLTLTGDTGGTINPNGLGNIGIIGGAGIAVAGNAIAHTLTITATGSAGVTYTAVSASPYVVLVGDYYISVDCSGGPITIQLPNAATLGQIFIIKDRTGSAGTNNITIQSVNGIVTLDTATSFVMNTAFETIEVIGNGTSYELL